jgi:large subunit ribosomal protein L4
VIFEGKIREHLFHAEVRRQLARRRAGTHSTKNRAAVSGGGIKPWKQKGTGRARQGTIRAPQWAGGGVVFGPTPRNYEHKLTKKTRRAALVGAISLRWKEGALVVADGLALSECKTKRAIAMLSALGVAGKSVAPRGSTCTTYCGTSAS